MAEKTIHELIKEDMDRGVAEMNRLLTVAMFTGPSARERFGMPPLAPPTWKDRLRWKLQHVKNYFVTIGRALRGDELVDPCDCDDY